MKNQVRIIAGQWRGRKIFFPNRRTLRPTPNRVKETLFNWLAPRMHGAHCLELYAGSASLSFEALSRYASHVLAIENDTETVAAIQKNAETLQVTNYKDMNFQVIQADCVSWLKTTSPQSLPFAPFDVVFVDPPYENNQILECLQLLKKPGWLSEDAVAYFEVNDPNFKNKLTDEWTILKEKQAGQVYYYLVTGGHV